MYDQLGEGLIGVPHTSNHRRLNQTVSPHKMLMHLGAGQAPIGTPLRSRIDS